MKSTLSRRFAESEQGQLQGATQSVASLAGITGPLFFGWIYGLSSASLPGLSFFLAAGTLALAAGSSAWAMRGRPIDT
jgi:DHA1 family tetracycline resistance protein-like MFS transporter